MIQNLKLIFNMNITGVANHTGFNIGGELTEIYEMFI